MKRPDKPGRRRNGTGRFFVVAVLIAVAIFAAIKIVQMELRPRAPANRQPTPSNATAAIAAASDSLKGFEVVLWRQGCAAGCPDYALHYSSGKLQYTGVRNVRKQGNLTTDFDRYHQDQLLQLVEQASFFGLADDYTLDSKKCHPSRADAPVYVVGVTLNGDTRKVKVNEGCTNVPPKLSRLARGFDKLAQSERWTGIIIATAAGSSGP